MIKFFGIIFISFSALGLERGFNLELVSWLLFGLFLVCSQAMFGHLMFVEREKVRAQFRGKK